jgi:hypothetical protein
MRLLHNSIAILKKICDKTNNICDKLLTGSNLPSRDGITATVSLRYVLIGLGACV